MFVATLTALPPLSKDDDDVVVVFAAAAANDGLDGTSDPPGDGIHEELSRAFLLLCLFGGHLCFLWGKQREKEERCFVVTSNCIWGKLYTLLHNIIIKRQHLLR